MKRCIDVLITSLNLKGFVTTYTVNEFYPKMEGHFTYVCSFLTQPDIIDFNPKDFFKCDSEYTL